MSYTLKFLASSLSSLPELRRTWNICGAWSARSARVSEMSALRLTNYVFRIEVATESAPSSRRDDCQTKAESTLHSLDAETGEALGHGHGHGHDKRSAPQRKCAAYTRPPRVLSDRCCRSWVRCFLHAPAMLEIDTGEAIGRHSVVAIECFGCAGAVRIPRLGPSGQLGRNEKPASPNSCLIA